MPKQEKKPLVLDVNQLETISKLAAVNYSPEKIAKFLGVNREAFMTVWYDSDSEVRNQYDSGQMIAQFEINDKLRLNAEAGNITAAQIFQKEAERMNVENIKQQVIFGGNEIEEN